MIIITGFLWILPIGSSCRLFVRTVLKTRLILNTVKALLWFVLTAMRNLEKKISYKELANAC